MALIIPKKANGLKDRKQSVSRAMNPHFTHLPY